jgi:outer membrane protein TolC
MDKTIEKLIYLDLRQQRVNTLYEVLGAYSHAINREAQDEIREEAKKSQKQIEKELLKLKN